MSAPISNVRPDPDTVLVDIVDYVLDFPIESTLALLAGRMRERGVTLVRDYASALPRIRAYPGDLNQVWSNLVDNALDVVPAIAGRVTVRTATEDGMVVGEVRDNGPGIPPELQERIFEPFFTTKEPGKGPGLGLDVARRIVADLHGGRLTLTSVPGDTRFVVALPVTTFSTLGV